MLISVDGLAAAQVSRGQHDDAVVLYAKAIEVARRTLGDDHPATVRMIDEYNRLVRVPTAPRDDSQE